MTSQTQNIAKKFVQIAILLGVMGCSSSFLYQSNADFNKEGGNSGKSIHFAANKDYNAECSSCHVGFLPGFLPERSWKKLMAGLEDHFGENASLDQDISSKISKYLVTNAADSAAASPRSKRIAKMIAANETPLRITESPFWVRKHRGIKSYVWKRAAVGPKSKCESCHRDAAKGLFSEYDVKIPK
jgi:nitrate/TMAO reductase-like tetraheme cytochrome c subunit